MRAAACALALVHLPFAELAWYGDADAAWDGIVAVLWSLRGELPLDAGVFPLVRFRSSPLPVGLARALLDLGWLSAGSLPVALNAIQLPVGIAIPAAFHALLARIATRRVAALATFLLLLSPLFFRMRCYGFPQLPALLLALLALLALARGVGGARPRVGWLVASAAATSGAVLTKSDALLLAPCWPVVALAAGGPLRPALRVGVALALPALAFVVWHVFCEALVPAGPGSAEALARWTVKWPLTPSGLLRGENLRNMAMAAGMASSAAGLAALALSLRDPPGRRAAAAAVLCAAPTLVFWGMRHLNSSRHNLWLALPLLVLLATRLARLPRPARIAALVLLGLGNYFVGPTERSSMLAPARWIESAQLHRRAVDVRRRGFAAAVRLPVDRLCFPQGGSNQWIVAAALEAAEPTPAPEVRVGGFAWDWQLDLVIEGRRKQLWLTSPFAALRPEALAAEGCTVVPPLPRYFLPAAR